MSISTLIYRSAYDAVKFLSPKTR